MSQKLVMTEERPSSQAPRSSGGCRQRRLGGCTIVQVENEIKGTSIPEGSAKRWEDEQVETPAISDNINQKQINLFANDSIVSHTRRQALPWEHRDSGERGTTGNCRRPMLHSELGTSMRVIFLPPQSASQPAPPGGSLFAIDSNASHDRRQALPGEHRECGERGTTEICRKPMLHSELGTSMQVIRPPQSASQPVPPRGSLTDRWLC